MRAFFGRLSACQPPAACPGHTVHQVPTLPCSGHLGINGVDQGIGGFFSLVIGKGLQKKIQACSLPAIMDAVQPAHQGIKGVAWMSFAGGVDKAAEKRFLRMLPLALPGAPAPLQSMPKKSCQKPYR